MPPRLFPLLLVLLAPIVLLAPAAHSQTAGQVLWTVDIEGFTAMSQPRVAPDGTIYVVTNKLYAISPQGALLWTASGYQSYVDLDADGTIYTAGGNTIFAYHPDGSEKWRFTESPAGQGIMQGPTVGPDGNLYAISDLGGLGAFSLTPAGALRWSLPGFSNNTGTGLGRIQFGQDDNFYFAEDWVPGCGPLTSGLTSLTLSGQSEWCLPISGVTRPWATLDGRALTWQGGMSGKTIFAYGPSGSLDWSHTFDFSPVAIGSIVVGPDNNIYAFHSISTLASLTASGSVRWEQDQPLDNFPWRAAVSPDVSALVSGSVYGFGNNGTIVAVDPADGSTLWSVPITGPSAGAGAPAEFSPDGTVVYVPVSTNDFAVPDQVWAVQVRDASAGGCVATSYCSTSPNSAGNGALMSHSGSTSVAANDLVLVAQGVVPGTTGLFFYGSNRTQLAFGDGVRCVGGQFFRFPPQQATAGGVAGRAVNLMNPPQPAGQITPGSTWHFQYWYRDVAAGGAGFNVSDGRSLTFCN